MRLKMYLFSVIISFSVVSGSISRMHKCHVAFIGLLCIQRSDVKKDEYLQWTYILQKQEQSHTLFTSQLMHPALFVIIETNDFIMSDKFPSLKHDYLTTFIYISYCF